MEFGKRHFVSLSLLIVSTVATASLTDIPLFLLNAFKKPHVVGAVLPCMSGVGKELTRYVVQSQDDNPSRPLNILEVGAGTGAMTEVVIANLRVILCCLYRHCTNPETIFVGQKTGRSYKKNEEIKAMALAVYDCRKNNPQECAAY